MPSKLSTLVENLITPGFKKFKETAKAFILKDMDLVTRKGVYPYEYTDRWEKLEEKTLPSKENFYSTLTEEYIESIYPNYDAILRQNMVNLLVSLWIFL
jgi:hypothetical protein